MRIKTGTKVLVKAIIVGVASDDRPEDEKGYIVKTSRGSLAYADPADILLSLKDLEEK